MTEVALAPAPRALGRSALTAFPLAYGCRRFAGTSVREVRAKLDAALALGVTPFDHADISSLRRGMVIEYRIVVASGGAPLP